TRFSRDWSSDVCSSDLPGGDAGERIAMESWPEAVASYDKNKDGKVSRDELSEGSPVLDRFYRIDLNQDKGLDEQEWTRHARVFEIGRASGRERRDMQGD